MGKGKKEVAIYGNYKGYYGYRLKSSVAGASSTSTSTSKRPRTELEGVDGVNSVLHPVTEPSIEQTRGISGYSSPSTLSDRVSFQEKNFVRSLCDRKRCDTIICLSVTKWIHLYWGDDGLIDLFAKIWRLLKPGGMLILEPQPWSSYKRKCKVSEITNENYKNIKIYPENFQDILLDKIGFRMVEDIGSTPGFQRPILAFWK